MFHSPVNCCNCNFQITVSFFPFTFLFQEKIRILPISTKFLIFSFGRFPFSLSLLGQHSVLCYRFHLSTYNKLTLQLLSDFSVFGSATFYVFFISRCDVIIHAFSHLAWPLFSTEASYSHALNARLGKTRGGWVK